MAVLPRVKEDGEMQPEKYINISLILFRRLTKRLGKKSRFSMSSLPRGASFTEKRFVALTDVWL